MAREINITTPEHVQVQFELAGIGSRFIALLLDTLIQGLVVTALVLATIAGFGGLAWLDRPSVAATWIIAILALLIFAIMTGYFLFFETTRNGQTPGKKLAGIRVIRDTGHPVDFRSALLRNVMRIVDSLPSCYGVGIVSVFFSPQYRRLGDYVGGTLVVKVGRASTMQPAPVSADTIPSQPTTEALPLLPADLVPFVSTIPKEEYRSVRHFLDRRAELDFDVAADLARRLAEPIAHRLDTDPAAIPDSLAFLEAVSKEWERQMIH
jgi:uncharacterized RDD family membrane protein YckC